MDDRTINSEVTMSGENATVLAGRYRVVRQLGQGGMESVWLAEDEKLDGFKVAIKMLPSVLVNNKRAYAQVKAEAFVSLKLSHSNIATVRAFEEESGNPFLVMDYIDGQTLDDYLAEKGKLTEEETIKLLKPVAAALDYAHTQGVVHRDVKPGNIMIRKDGTPFVLDFGIAREIQETMTRVTGKLSSGTLLYMSPEQLHGAAPKSEQDVYSFAAMAYECLAGRPPFERGQIEYQIEHDIPAPLGEHIAICSQVMAGLEKTPEARPATCAAVLEKEAKSRGVGDGAPARRSRIAVVLLGVFTLVALIGVVGWFLRQKSMSDELAAERARQVENAMREAARQKAEAEKTSKRGVVIRTFTGDCEVRAMVSIGGKKFKAPVRFEKIKRGDFIGDAVAACVFQGKYYEGRMNRMVIDWEGEKEIGLQLNQFTLPFWVMDNKIKYSDSERIVFISKNSDAGGVPKRYEAERGDMIGDTGYRFVDFSHFGAPCEYLRLSVVRDSDGLEVRFYAGERAEVASVTGGLLEHERK